MGEMADYYTDGYADPLRDLYDEKMCRYCGKCELSWGNTGSKSNPKWRLMDKNSTVHSCPEYIPTGEKMPTVWVVEMWNQNRSRWEPTIGSALNRQDGREVRKNWKKRNPDDRFRLKQYKRQP